jgi:Protein of unknown function (DUF1573)
MISHRFTGLLLTVMLAMGIAAAGAAEPRLEVPKRVLNGGEVEPGPKLVLEFPIRNAGDGTLEITRVAPGCGCMVARYDRRLAPGARGAIRVLFDTAGRHGAIRKNIAVESNDPDTPRLVLTVQMLLRRAVEVSPGEEVTLPLESGRAGEQELVLRSYEKGPFRVTSVVCSLPGAQTRLLSPMEVAERLGEKPDACAIVHLTLPAAASERAFEATVTIETNSRRRPRLEVRLCGVPRTAVSVNPPHLYFGTVSRRKGQAVTRAISLFRPRGNVHVLSVESSDPRLRLRVEPDPSGTLCDVVVEYPGGWPLGLARGTITICTDDPRRPKIRVPFTAEVAEEADPA